MKKLFFISALALSMAFTGTCFGVDITSSPGAITDTGPDPDGPGITNITPSPNVSLSYIGGGSGVRFNLTGINTKGTVAYGAYSGSTNIYQKSQTDGTLITATDSSASTGMFTTANSWTAMGQ